MDTKIIDRIKKMLALANDSAASDGERDNALRMAYATLAKHNLDISSLEEVESRELVEWENNGYVMPWVRRTAMSVANLFFCNYFYTKTRAGFRHSFVGKTSNAVTAKMMAEYVISSIRKEAGKRARAESLTSSWVTSFCKGGSDVVYQRCKELRAAQESSDACTGTSLVLASLYKTETDANAEFIRIGLGLKLSSSKTSERRAGFGYNDGADFGKGINLALQVTGAAGNQQLRIGC
jgi:hypothetical protein